MLPYVDSSVKLFMFGYLCSDDCDMSIPARDLRKTSALRQELPETGIGRGVIDFAGEGVSKGRAVAGTIRGVGAVFAKVEFIK